MNQSVWVRIYLQLYIYIFIFPLFLYLFYSCIHTFYLFKGWWVGFFFPPFLLACTILTRSVFIDPFAAPTTPLWEVSRGPGPLGTLPMTVPCSLWSPWGYKIDCSAPPQTPAAGSTCSSFPSSVFIFLFYIYISSWQKKKRKHTKKQKNEKYINHQKNQKRKQTTKKEIT